MPLQTVGGFHLYLCCYNIIWMISWFFVLKSRGKTGSVFLQTRERSYDISERFSVIKLGWVQPTACFWLNNTLFEQFCRTILKFLPLKFLFLPSQFCFLPTQSWWNRTKQTLSSMKTAFLSQNVQKITRWESHISQELFQSSDLGVKWKGMICKVFLIIYWL